MVAYGSWNIGTCAVYCTVIVNNSKLGIVAVGTITIGK